MSLKDMSRDELLALKQEKHDATVVLRDEMRALNVVLDIRTAEMKQRERDAAAGNPDATSTKVIGTVARAPADGRV